MRFKNTFISFICTIVLIFSCAADSSAISIPDEKELGKKFMKMINKRQMTLKDPIAQHFINQIGQHILSVLPPQPFKYSFYLIDEDVFNAFAAPGANIFFYRGLITSLDSVDELAGIVGHEIAHAVSRHVSESIDRSKYINIGSLAGVLAGAIIGSQTNSDATSTIIKGSLALGQTTMLAYTRENETEADEKGIMFLKNTCFSPFGLLSGLNKIRLSDFRGVEGIPDYVKTHPGTGKRIAHTESILSNYKHDPQKTACRIDFEFDIVKYRLMGLYAPLDAAFTKLTTTVSEKPDNAAVHYGLGLVYDRKQRKDQAIKHLKKALDIRLFDPVVLTDLGRVYISNGEPQRALDILKGLENETVVGVLARLYQADAYLELADYNSAEKRYTAVINKAPETFPKAYFNLARIKSMNNETGLSHYYLGIHYTLEKNTKSAVHHLEKSLENLLDESRVKDAKARLERLKKDQKKAAKQKG